MKLSNYEKFNFIRTEIVEKCYDLSKCSFILTFMLLRLQNKYIWIINQLYQHMIMADQWSSIKNLILRLILTTSLHLLCMNYVEFVAG